MAQDTIQTYSDRISNLLADRLRIKGRSLKRQVYKAGPKLPRQVRKAASVVVEAQALAQHPKLSRQQDDAAVRKASEMVIAHLEAIDPWDRMKGRVLGWLGWASAILIVSFAAWVWYARSRGMI